jgi:hypothetical protein
MAAAPDRSEVATWVAEHGLELVQVAAEMIERGKLRRRRGIAAFLTAHHGRDPDWVRSDAGLPTRPKAPPAKPPAAEPEASPAPDRDDLVKQVAALEAKPRLRVDERVLLSMALEELAALDAAEGGAR